jgi:hypothetical protein
MAELVGRQRPILPAIVHRLALDPGHGGPLSRLASRWSIRRPDELAATVTATTATNRYHRLTSATVHALVMAQYLAIWHT